MAMNNSLAEVRPELVPEWSEKNLPLKPDEITFGSNKKVWWRGACGHEWQTSVKARSNGEKCPICSGARVIAGINDLTTLEPLLVKQWSKKNKIKPTEVSIGSHKKVIWRCEKGHEWEAAVKSRTINKTGCPYCSHNKVLAGFNDLATLLPDIAAEWSDRNYPLLPTQVTVFANRKAWWKCKDCGREWNTLISTRSGGSKCPYCSGYIFSKGFNDLQTTHPEIASEWSEKNLPLKPDEVNAKSRKNVWWKCRKCGNEWKSFVNARVKGTVCPVCAEREVLAGYNDLATTDNQLLSEWDYEQNKLKPTEVSRTSAKRAWWKCRHGHSWSMKINERTILNKGCRICEQEYLSLFPALAVSYSVYGFTTQKARYTTLNDIYELWKDLKRGLKNNTFENYKYMYETFVRQQLGSKTVSSLKKSDIKRFYNYLADERHLKPATIDNIHTVLHQILDMAVDDDYLRNNPSNNVLKELKQSHCFQTEKRRALTRPEQELLLSYLKNTPSASLWYPIFAVLIGTGLRVGEATGLRWCDIDLEEGIIDVNHTLVYYDHRTEGSKRGCYFNINTTKTPAGKRQVPMLDFVKEAFLMEKERQELLDIHCEAVVDGYTDFIFLNRFGQPQHQATLNKAIRRIIRDCNDEQLLKDENAKILLPHFSCHSLRHTFTTRMCEAGVNVKVIQDTLGHKDISTTLNIYTDVTKELRRSEFEGLDSYFKNEYNKAANI